MRNAVPMTSVVRISPAGTIPNNNIRPLSVCQNRRLRAGVGDEGRVISGSLPGASFSEKQSWFERRFRGAGHVIETNVMEHERRKRVCFSRAWTFSPDEFAH